MPKSYHEIKFGAEIRKRTGQWLTCITCGTSFYAHPCRMRLKMVKYCSRKCYDKRGTNNPFHGKKHTDKSIKKMINNPNRHTFKSGSENYNAVRFGEYFEGKSFQWWRRYLIRTVGKCELCGIDDKRILHAHHKDKDRKNNTRENLVLVCPNCHALEHHKDGSGWFTHMKHG